MASLRFRTIFISDVHLGTPDCRADFLLDFLDQSESEQLYLIGDMVDLVRMRRRVHWPQSHSRVIERLTEKGAQGTRVIYIPGNHDHPFRTYVGQRFAGIEIEREQIHTSADGRRFLVSHGDELDGDVHFHPLLQAIGDWAYNLLLAANRHLNRLRRWLGRDYWSLSYFVKRRSERAARYIRRFEQAGARRAQQGGYDGFICGHIHKGEIAEYDGVLYCNDGDWVEHCTALVERFDGRLQLIHWSDQRAILVSHDGERISRGVQPLEMDIEHRTD